MNGRLRKPKPPPPRSRRRSVRSSLPTPALAFKSGRELEIVLFRLPFFVRTRPRVDRVLADSRQHARRTRSTVANQGSLLQGIPQKWCYPSYGYAAGVQDRRLRRHQGELGNARWYAVQVVPRQDWYHLERNKACVGCRGQQAGAVSHRVCRIGACCACFV